MPRWETVGEVSHMGNGFKWQVEDRYFMPDAADTHIASPLFDYAKTVWYFTKQPDGYGSWFGLGLCSTSSDSPELLVKISLFNDSGALKSCEGRTGPFGFEEPRFMKYSQFAKRRTEIAPGGCVRIFLAVYCIKGNAELMKHCRIRSPESVSSEAPVVDGATGIENDAKNVEMIHRCVQTDDLPTSKGIGKLQQDLKNMLLTKEHSDITIKVQEEEFLAHKIILRARCPVFYAMFKYKMTEQTSGVVVIDDCEPGCFQHFLNYIYTGSIDDITEENVFPLYIIADKYCLDDLKSYCVEYIKATLSTESFCAAMTLSIRYSEAELSELASDFFTRNMSDILLTKEWELFLHENTAEGCEMLAKAVIMPKEHNT